MKDLIIAAGFAVCFLAAAGILWNERVISRHQCKGRYTDIDRARGYVGMVAGTIIFIGGIALFSYGFVG